MSFPLACKFDPDGKKAEKVWAAVWLLAVVLGGFLLAGLARTETVWAENSGSDTTAQVYVVQLNSFKQKANANEFVRSVKTRGYTPFVHTEGDKKIWYKVRVGPYPTSGEAGEVARSLRKKHGWPAIVVPVPGKRGKRSALAKAEAPADTSASQALLEPDSGDSIDIVMSRFLVWLKAWQEKNANSYFSFYSHNLQDTGKSFKEWQASRLKTFRKSGRITISVSEVRMNKGTDRIEMLFIQEYESDVLSDVGRKLLVWKREGNRWRIVREQWKPIS